MKPNLSKVAPGASQRANWGRPHKGITRPVSVATVDGMELNVQSTPSLAEVEPELARDITRLFVNPRIWLDTPHPELEGHKPSEFLEHGRQQPLRDLIAAIKYGLFA